MLEGHRRGGESLARFGGREVKSTGDGFLADLRRPGPRDPLCRGVARLLAAARDPGPRGLHTVSARRWGRPGGIAVHIAARVSGLAEPSEVLVSRTVKDLVAGSGIEFADRGEHELKGVPGHLGAARGRAPTRGVACELLSAGSAGGSGTTCSV